MSGGGCAQCGRADSKLRVCGGCGTARFCNDACQRAGWQAHKAACRAAAAAASAANAAALEAACDTLATAVTANGFAAVPQIRDAAALAARAHGGDCLVTAFLLLKAAEQSVHPNAPGPALPRWRAGLADWAAAHALLLRRAAATDALPPQLPHERDFYARWGACIAATRGAPHNAAATAITARLADAMRHCLGAQAAYVALILLSPVKFGVAGFALAPEQRGAMEAAVLSAADAAGGTAAAAVPVGPEEMQLSAVLPHVRRDAGGLRPAFAAALLDRWDRVAQPGLRRRGLPAGFPLHLL